MNYSTNTDKTQITFTNVMLESGIKKFSESEWQVANAIYDAYKRLTERVENDERECG